MLFLNALAASSSSCSEFMKTGGSIPTLLQQLQEHGQFFLNSWIKSLFNMSRAAVTGKGELAVNTGPGCGPRSRAFAVIMSQEFIPLRFAITKSQVRKVSEELKHP